MTEDKGKSAFPPDNSLQWIDDNIPFSTQFGDSYYSKSDGRSETGHVFIEGNDLPARWPGMGDCLIAELGFGTGLNFLETLRQWREITPTNAHLTFLSFELHPLSAAEIENALSRWPLLSKLTALLLDDWQPQSEMQTIRFDDGRVELVIFASDANIRLPQTDFEADAWFLDGFAPSRNPELWGEALLAQIFEHTKPGGTFATYTAAGWVRRNLQRAGFEVARQPGFAGKREMMNGSKPM